jgi:hypothetical protein
LADDEFVALKRAASDMTQTIQERLEAGERNIAVDYISVQRFLEHSSDVVRLVFEAFKVGFSFPDETDEDIDSHSEISDLVSMMSLVGISSLAQLETVLQGSVSWAKTYFSMLIHAAGHWTVSREFLCQLVLIGAFPNKFTLDYLVQQLGWGKKIANSVIVLAHDFSHMRNPKSKQSL